MQFGNNADNFGGLAFRRPFGQPKQMIFISAVRQIIFKNMRIIVSIPKNAIKHSIITLHMYLGYPTRKSVTFPLFDNP